MKLCVFSDIHGNRHYFEAIMQTWIDGGYDRFIFLGDAVGYFPDGEWVLNWLQEKNVRCICGNHDAMLTGAIPLPVSKDEVYQIQETRLHMLKKNLDFIRSWPDSIEEKIDGINLFFVHGTPDSPLEGYGYEDTAITAFDQPGIDFLFIGQTHRPWIRKNMHTTVVNVGSIGLPRDHGSRPSYAVLDTITKQADIIRQTVNPLPILQAPGKIHPVVLNCLRRE